MYDLGATVPLAMNVVGADGVTPSNAATVTLTITQPDGTTTSPAITNPPAVTGSYIDLFLPTQAGRHVVNWTTTGPNTAVSDVFDVRASAVSPLVSVADVKDYLNITSSLDDERLRNFIATATHIIEDACGAVTRRTVVDHFDGDWSQTILVPRTQPVISIGSIVENGVNLTAGVDFILSDLGYIRRVAGGYARGWVYSVNGITVTYDAGRPIVPANLLEAAKEIVRVNFRSQRGGNSAVFDGSQGDTYEPGSDEVRMGFYVPLRVVELMHPHLESNPGFG